ncbi:hypothetical protein ACRE_030560 [Hapsidospora chrysogenum ATCC 11550]|uniref:Uncharacterized protein n=1 Tax=Hapsidospora chrysogenum (strain ATCC 11550 / CBS 779.69 / DSM 880 / IAM 14645 / JCM 23072 / IMI 49137) TaxID=857340 RepID=A0A086T9M4_HAPC1|nr:hypothetical protein ACRE_030560 [Hapsidospora chrysogenum ATCC 11550]
MDDAKQSHPPTAQRADSSHVIWAPSTNNNIQSDCPSSWQERPVQRVLAKYPVDVFNPLRLNWDSLHLERGILGQPLG